MPKIGLLLSFLLVVGVCAQRKEEGHQREENNRLEYPERVTRDESARGGYDREEEPRDPCREKNCELGHECDIDDDGNAICVCMRSCPTENDSKACSTLNVTFESECELHRQKCVCQVNRPECKNPSYRDAHLDYYGACQELRDCQQEQIDEFPFRMRQWLYLVMEELARRNDLPEPAIRMAKEAKLRPTKKWVLPVIWKFCELDVTHDSFVSVLELLPMSAPLKRYEHCIGPFLQSCDTNDSGTISLDEWGTCLKLDPEDLEDRCEALKQ